MKELLIENAIDTLSDMVKMLPLIRYLRVGERYCLISYFDNLIGKMHFTMPLHQHDFIEIASPVWYVRRSAFHIRF
jgi:acyl-CoA hydrolase